MGGTLSIAVLDSFLSEYLSEELIRRFAPFRTEESKLPNCAVRIWSDRACDVLLHEYPQLADALKRRTEAGNSQKQWIINEYALRPCLDGVLLSAGEDVAVWVHARYQRMEAIVSPTLKETVVLMNALLRGYQYVALHAGALMMHAAAVSHRGGGLLFCGVPGAGKSTQALLWRVMLQAEELNNDQPCLLFQNGTAYVHGSPWSGKEPVYKNVCVPVKAIVFVEKSKENKIVPLSGAEAYSLLYLNEYVVPVREENESAYDAAIEKIVLSLPVLRQFCTATASAAKTLETYLSNL